MGKLRIVNQPIRVSDLSLDELDDKVQDYWDHMAENVEARRVRQQRKLFKANV